MEMENKDSHAMMQNGNEEMRISLESEKEYLTDDIQKSANWFFWIAVLSIINSVLFYIAPGLNFILGLGITQLVDGIIIDLMNASKWLALIPNLIIAGIFCFIGYRAKKYDKWTFAIGVVIYTLDAFLFLYVKDWIGLGVHAFVLVMLSKGFYKVFEYDKVCKKLSENANN